MRRDEVQVQDVVTDEGIQLGEATLTVNEALALWLWLLADDQDAVQLALPEQALNDTVYPALWCEAA